MNDKGKTTVTEAVVTVVKQIAAEEEFGKWWRESNHTQNDTTLKRWYYDAYLAGRKARQEQDAMIAKEIGSCSSNSNDDICTAEHIATTIRAQE